MIVVGLLLALIIVVMPIVLVVRALSGRGEEAGWSLRRILQYGFLLAAVIITAIGLSGLLEAAIPAAAPFVSDEASRLARSLAFTLVGIPATWLLWRLVDRRLRDDEEERRAVPWPLYLAVAATTALITAYVGWASVGEWALGVQDFERDALARGVVWTLVWVVHWRLLTEWRAPGGPGASLTELAGSATGLYGLAGGLASILSTALESAFDAMRGDGLVAGTGGDVREGAVIAVLGAAIWWSHWLRRALHAERNPLWYGYVELVATLPALLAAVGGAGSIIYQTLLWAFQVDTGDPLEQLPGALTALMLGSAAWVYHRSILGVPRHRRPTEAERAYDYLVAAVGLLTAATGISVALVAGLEAVSPRPLAGDTGLVTLSAAMAALLVGAPLWWVLWRRIERRTDADPEIERRAASRRVYLVVLFGLTGLTALVSLIVMLFTLFRDLLEGTLAGETLFDIRIPLSLLLTAGAVSAYHWAIYRQDREVLGPEETRVRRSVVLVTADPNLGRALHHRTGAQVRIWRHVEGEAPTEGALERLEQVLRDASQTRLLIVVDGFGERVIPFERD